MNKWLLIQWWRFQFLLIKWRPILSRLIGLSVLLCIVIALGAYIGNFHTYEISKNPESWAHFGDYLGGIFSFFSFMALLYTVHLQIQELKATREELKLSRQAQQESAEAQEQSAEVLRKQQFENTFFQLLNQVTLHINKLASTTDNMNTIKYLYSQLERYDFYDGKERKYNVDLNDFQEEYDRIKNYSNISFYSKIEKFQKECHNNRPAFPQFCLIVYQLLKLIRNSPYSNEKTEATNEEKQYSNFLRAILTPEILQLMALYCYRQDKESSFKSYQELIERYALFEHMPFHCLEEDSAKNNLRPTVKDIAYSGSGQRYFYLFIYIYYKYDRSAFGDNETLKLIEPKLKKISIE